MIKSTLRASFCFAALALFAASATVTGCGGPSVESLCDDACDCERCDDDEFDECVSDLGRGQERAEEKGCGEAFDALLRCFDESLTCTNDKVEVARCRAEETAIDKCLGGGVDDAPPPAGDP